MHKNTVNTSTSSHGKATPQPRKVLLVEDDPTIQMVHRAFLEKLGYEVDAVTTGEDALDYASQQAYSAMLLDLGLPQMQGDEVIEQIRKREQTTGKHLPIIIATAHGLEKDLKACRDKGADEAFIKPISMAQLREILPPLLTRFPVESS
jgi:CheY-like chemotaxis protein